MGNVQQNQQQPQPKISLEKQKEMKLQHVVTDKTPKNNKIQSKQQKNLRSLQPFKNPFKAKFHKNLPHIFTETKISMEIQQTVKDYEKQSKLNVKQNKQNIAQDSSVIQLFIAAKELKTGKIEVNRSYFLKIKKKNYLQQYLYIKQLGKGSYGTVAKIKMKYGPHNRAVKIIKQNQAFKLQSSRQKFFAEIALPNMLDHPNIGKLLQVFQFKNTFALIMQLCQGGDLLAYIKQHKIFKQLDASKLFYQIISAVNYMHKQGICHRDLKPQNILFDNITSRIKIIDFGTAARFIDGQKFTSIVGSPYYIAPQVLQKKFDEKCDIWSCGVLLYVILSGQPPFKGKNQQQLMQNIIHKPLQFSGSIWSQRSKQSKQLITRMLKKDPRQRISSQQIMNSIWLTKNKQITQQLDSQYGKKVLGNLKAFHFKNKLKAVVYTYIASQLYQNKDKQKLLQTFMQIDKDGSGIIERQQLIKVFTQSKTSLSNEQVQNILNIIDTNGSGKIDFTQFLVAATNQQELLKKKQIQAAFAFLDSDHSGFISYEQIRTFLDDSQQTIQELKDIFNKVDQNNDGKLSKKQFINLLLKDDKK